MALVSDRRVFPCREFEPIDIPLDLLIVDGAVNLYPEASKYFDLDYRAGRIVVAPKSFVGLIPVNDLVAIHVLPRFSIDNIFYLLQRASAVLRFIDGHVRGYEVEAAAEGTDPLELLASRFACAAERILRTGLLRNYVESNLSIPFSGALDISATVEMFRSKGVNYTHVWRSDELTDNLLENSLIRSALVRVVDYLGARRDTSAKKQLGSVRLLLKEFDQVDFLDDGLVLNESSIARMIDRLPGSHREYASLLWLSFLINARRGLFIERLGRACFDTFVVNLADVFEEYVRVVISEHFRGLGGGFSVLDGNKDQVPLFANTSQFKVKPDIYVLSGRVALAVLDAKYKPVIKPADRYEVIAFCEALQVKTAVVISPSVDAAGFEALGRTSGGIEFWHGRINLGARDMVAEERAFLAEISRVVVGPAK